MLNIKQIQEIIPHRYPFLLIDKIEDLEPGIKAVGYKNVTMNEYFFQGHFPSEPVMPGGTHYRGSGTGGRRMSSFP